MDDGTIEADEAARASAGVRDKASMLNQDENPDPTAFFLSSYRCSTCEGEGTVTRYSGDKLRAKRLELGITQRAMARFLNVSYGHLCDMENGRRDIPSSIMLRFVHAVQAVEGGVIIVVETDKIKVISRNSRHTATERLSKAGV